MGQRLTCMEEVARATLGPVLSRRGGAVAFAALITWFAAILLGLFMLAVWLIENDVTGRVVAPSRLPVVIIFAHLSLGRDEPAVQALYHGIVDGLADFYDQDRERLLERIKLAFRTPALHPRLRQQQADWAAGMTALLAARLGTPPDDLEVRATAAAIAAALFVAIEEWQARDGQADLRPLIHRALDSVLARPVPATAAPKRR
jgi:MftR C-terminal domain